MAQVEDSASFSHASVGWCICSAKTPKQHKLALQAYSLHLKPKQWDM